MFRRPAPILAVLIVIASIGTAFAETAFFPRRPAISPDGGTVVFTCQGDLWRVPAEGGPAVRLTAHPAYERDPVFSPDGAWLAFASDREGSFDVYVMPAAGGRPQRLTFAPSGDLPQSFSADGKQVYFAASRPWRYPVADQIQTVPVTGGTPFRLLDLFADEVAVHADGERLLLTVGYHRFGRVGYRGSLQSDLWLHRPGSAVAPERLTDGPGFDTDPMWGPGDAVYWRSEDDQTHAFNIWRLDPDGSRRRLTDFREEGVRNARISGDGSRIVCEAGQDLWILETASGQLRRLDIDVAADQLTDAETYANKTGGADELDVDDEGDEIALVVDGEIVLVNRELEGRATVAMPSPWRESGVAWRPGSADTLVVVSDREEKGGVPYSRIGLVVSDDPDVSQLRKARRHRIAWLTPGGVECADPQWSPDGSRLAYLHGKGRLAVMDPDGGNRRFLYEGWDDPEFAWSPDGNWLAYAVASGPDFNTDIWLVPAAGGEAVNVSQHPDRDTGPVWNEDGTMLAWSSRRYGNQADVVFCYLTRADDERSREEWEIWQKTRDDDEKPDPAKKKDGADDADEGDEKAAKVAKEPIRIDLDEIHLRVRRLTSLPDDEYVVAIHPQGDRIAFSASIGDKRDLYTVDRFGEEREALTKGGESPRAAFLAADGKTVWMLADGKPAHVALKGGDLERIAFRARLATDHAALRRQVVEEAWRMLRDRFYDPDMHGIDWPAQREKALALAAGIDHDADFADVMNIMLRSLNASHMGYYPGGRGDRGGAGWLGLSFDPQHRGPGLAVAAVVPHGPADLADGGFVAGDVILAVDGVEVGRDQNFHAPVVAAGGECGWVRYSRGDDFAFAEGLGAAPTVTRGALRQQIYEADVKANRARVEELGDGEIAYVHIQGMGLPQVEIFERDLYAAASGKDARIRRARGRLDHRPGRC